ncbi:MAG: AMP-binding protein [Chloroflexota bacterium]
MRGLVALRGRNHRELARNFRWKVRERLNIGVACADAQPARRGALVHVAPDGARRLTFGELARQSNRMANALLGLGLVAGDRVAVILPQAPETAVAHLGTYKAGMVAVPLSVLFGPDALRFRLQDSGARAVVIDDATLQRLEPVLRELPDLAHVLLVDGGGQAGRVRSLASTLAAAGDAFAADTAAADPALIIYTSGTTGSPKGVVHAHRVLIGQAPGFRLAHERLPAPGDLMWTPADWAWIGGLVNTALLAWAHGVPMVSAPRRGFDPEWALHLMDRQPIRNTFLPTTALRMLRGHRVPQGVHLRSLMSGGEAQEPELVEATRAAFGLYTNEAYGQTEADFLVGHCASAWPPRPGAMGLAYPGHEVELQAEDGSPVAPGEVGEVVVRSPDPTFLLEYWKRPAATAAKYRGDWLRTGDLARQDEAGYLWFESRADDIIKSSGYRIGPGEVEECLLRHPAVAAAAVVGAPDPVRGQVVRAYLVLRPGHSAGAALEAELQGEVRSRLAAYQYPRQFEFLDALPLTSSGKVDRRELRWRASGAVPGLEEESIGR